MVWARRFSILWHPVAADWTPPKQEWCSLEPGSLEDWIEGKISEAGAGCKACGLGFDWRLVVFPHAGRSERSADSQTLTLTPRATHKSKINLQTLIPIPTFVSLA